jgi:hypothetical protein
MGLLSASDEAVLKQHLSAIESRVSLLLFTQTFGGSESGPIARQVLDEIAALNDKIEVVEKNFVLDTEDRTKYAIEREPAIVVLRDGTGNLELDPATVQRLAAVDKPTDIKVFSTPT